MGLFTLVGLGLGDASDITLKGLEAVKRADVVYLEAYTSLLINTTAEELSSAYGRPITVADRDMVESGSVLEAAAASATAGEKEDDNPRDDDNNHNNSGSSVVLLVVGDVFGATTHSDLMVRCHEQHIPTAVVHNASIINAVGCCGLQLYRFGQVLSMCFWTSTWRPDSYYARLVANRAQGVHTLLLLDIKVKEVSDENLARGRTNVYEPPRFMSISQALEQLFEVEAQRQSGVINDDTIFVGMARIGSATSQQVVAGTRSELAPIDFGAPLHSLIVAGDIHEFEAEHLRMFAVNKDSIKWVR